MGGTAYLTKDNISTSDNGDTYLNVGTGINNYNYTEQIWVGNLSVGDTNTTQGDVDKVGAFDDGGNLKTPSGKDVFTNNLEVTGDVTVQGEGIIRLGGSTGSKYTGLKANSLTVTGGTADITKLETGSLKVSEGTVKISGTDGCTDGSAGLNGKYQSYIKNSLIQEGGTLILGNYNANLSTPGSHRQNSFGGGYNAAPFELTQTGGNMTVWGESSLNPKATITQKDNAGNMIFRDTLFVYQAGGGECNVNINQEADAATLVIGKLKVDGTVDRVQGVNINQSGKGLIHLAYGTKIDKDRQRSIKLNQTGGGNIVLGGGHDTEITGELPEDYELTGYESTNSVYQITQSEDGGSIALKDGVNITASSVVQSSAAAELLLESGSKMTTDSLTVSGSVTNYGTISADTINLNDGKLLLGNGSTLELVLDDTAALVFGEGDIEFATDATMVNVKLILDNMESGTLSSDFVLASGNTTSMNSFYDKINTGTLTVSFEDNEGTALTDYSLTLDESGKLVVTAAVPEPTTATLSLLALAALAARRRRK